jgi:RNA polymerase primary sigma factor
MTTVAISDDLISAAQAGSSDDMWEIVSRCDAMLAGIVRQVAPGAGREDAEDLLQEARAALIERVRSYDSTSSAAALQTYVYTSVRRAVAESWVRARTGLTIEPSTVLRVRKALVDYDGNSEAAFLAVQVRHQISRETFMAVMEALSDPESWDAHVRIAGRASHAHQELTLADVVADPEADVTDPVERRELAHWLLRRIDPRQSYTLRSYYGVGMEKAEDADVADHLRVSPALVRKLRSRGIAACRQEASRHDLAA